MRAMILGLALIFLSSAVYPETLTLTIEQSIGALNGLRALDGYQDEAKNGATSVVVHKPFVFDGPTRMAIAHDLLVVQPIQQAFVKAHQDKICELSPACKIDDGTTDAKTLADYDRVTLSTSAGALDLTMLTMDQLQLDKNPGISGTVLSLLDPILKK